jgi:catalase
LWNNQPEYAEPPLTLEGDADHYDHRLVDDHWEQPGNLFRKMTPSKSSCSSTTVPARSMAPRRRSWSGMLRTAVEPILPMAMVWHEH